MIATYAPLFILFLVAGIVALGFFLATPLVGTRKSPTPEKMTPFECGSESTGGRNVKLSVKFYLVAILFVVFDVEAVFLYPWAIQFRSLGDAGLYTVMSFLVILALVFVYCWKKGALEWER